MLVEKWSQTVRAVGYGKASKPTSTTIMAMELCISDKNKPLLLANSTFIPYVVDALLLVRAELTQLSECTCTSGLRETVALAYRLHLTTVLRRHRSLDSRIQSTQEQAWWMT